ncbi:MAG: radical SAM protein [Deferribacterales bacterium]
MNTLTPVTLSDGLIVETVWYPYGTLCISSQAGCRIGCPFCASGRKGLVRSLTCEEMMVQAKTAEAKRITISGIGEPLDNFIAVKEFIERSELPAAVTTTACSFLVKDLLMLNHNGVMISVHAGTETAHKKLIPNTRPLKDIYDDIAQVWDTMSVRSRKKLGFNYLLVEGVNDSYAEIDAHIENMGRFPQASTHLLILNHVDKSPYKSPPREKYDEIYEYMRSKGLNVRRANQWRRKDLGGCGTLWLKSLEEKC